MKHRLHERSLLPPGGDGIDVRTRLQGGRGGIRVVLFEGAEEIGVGFGNSGGGFGTGLG